MTPLSLTVTPSSVAGAYQATESGGSAIGDSGASSFGGALQRAIGDAVDTGHQAETQSMQAIAGGGNLSEVVTAVNKAEVVLQTTVAIRDRMVQAYQQIMNMPI